MNYDDEELEEKIEDLENKIYRLDDELKSKIGHWELFSTISIIIVFALWGDKIWGFVKIIFGLIVFFILNLFEKI